MSSPEPDVSIVIVSFNTKELLRNCLRTLDENRGTISCETFVVDNQSRDGSPEMVEEEFPAVRLIRAETNLGFAAANNRAFERASGRYIVLLNSDAFLHPEALERSVRYMDDDPGIGLGGARLVGQDGSWQPSARMFPSILNDLLTFTGLANRFPRSRFFGRFDRTWSDPDQAADVDWVPGAYSIVRRELVERLAGFDEKFFLYYEEVDLCRRIRREGLRIRYWPDVVVTHVGGESSKQVKRLKLSSAGSQLLLWRVRSALLYYRKHHSRLTAWLAMRMESWWYGLRGWKNGGSPNEEARAKAEESRTIVSCLRQAWADTAGGRVSPPRPW